MYSLCPDVYLTRRQRLHYVLDDDGNLAWSGKDIHAAITFLIAEDRSSFELDAGDHKEKLLLTARRG